MRRSRVHLFAAYAMVAVWLLGPAAWAAFIAKDPGQLTPRDTAAMAFLGGAWVLALVFLALSIVHYHCETVVAAIRELKSAPAQAMTVPAMPQAVAPIATASRPAGTRLKILRKDGITITKDLDTTDPTKLARAREKIAEQGGKILSVSEIA